MDRKQAQEIIGKKVIIDEGQEGSYIGILNDVIAPPRKTWRGTVTIQAIAELPTFILDEKNQHVMQPLKYSENEIIECIGSKLIAYENDEPVTFRKSLTIAAQLRWNELQNQFEQATLQKNVLNQFLSSLGLSPFTEVRSSNTDEDADEEFISYTFQKEKDRYILVDDQNEQLDLQDCPFEFEWSHKRKSFSGYYEENGTFISQDGIRFSPAEGTIFTIDKRQFDPYFILQNELEPDALKSLEKVLKSLGLTHDHIVDCHNSLLNQLLNANGEKEFNGVNFLTYQGKQGIVVIQHHFDRKLNDHSSDEIYDRFEITTERGKRSIVTYTSNVSKRG
ncbi:DUF2777 family protein [bacterium LRH843]|nr:DUF2777 family protein [bacterium LRH843]